jgi:hypothetical protein
MPNRSANIGGYTNPWSRIVHLCHTSPHNNLVRLLTWTLPDADPHLILHSLGT